MGIFKREQRADSVKADFLSSMSGSEVTAAMAMNIPAVAASVGWISERIASLPIRLYYKHDGETEEIADDHRIRLLNVASDADTMTAHEAKAAMVRDYLLHGSGYLFIDWRRNEVAGLHYVAHDEVSYTKSTDPIFRSATYYIGGCDYRPYRLLRLLRHTDDGVRGHSILKENGELLLIAYSTLLFEKKLIKSGGCRKAYIKSEKPVGEKAFAALKEAWRRLFTLDGDAAIVLNAGVDVKEASSSPVELQLRENKSANADQLFALFGLSKSIINGTADDDQIAHAVETALFPIISAFETVLNRNLLLESEKSSKYFALDLKALLRGNIEKRYRAYQIALQAGFMQVDEVRYAEDMKPMGFNFVKLGLQDVLLNPATMKIYTPNTNALTDLKAGSVIEGGDTSEN